MENLGNMEVFCEARRFFRAPSAAVETEETPLNPNRYETTQSSMTNTQYPTEDFECMECGPSPPVPSMCDSFSDLGIGCHEYLFRLKIRFSLMDQTKKVEGMRLLEAIEQGKIQADNILQFFENSLQLEKNIAFLWSAFLKRSDLLEGLLSIGAELNFCDQYGFSALHLAAFSGCLPSTSFLISKQMEVNMQPKRYTPLHCAAFGNSLESAKLLLDNGALISIDTKSRSCKGSLLHCAVRANSLDCVKLFIEQGADVNSLKPSGANAIHLAAYLGHTKCLEALLNAPGADLNRKISTPGKESTALHLAAYKDYVECVKLLLAKGADSNLKNDWGLTALHLAASKSSLECVKLLLEKGKADPNAESVDDSTPLHAGVVKSEHAYNILLTLIFWGAKVNHQDKNGFTALHFAARNGLALCLEALLYFPDADPNIESGTNEKHLTALHLAADEGHIECVDLLLSKGAYSNLKNDQGFTALHFAARTSSLECVKLLLEKGNADPNARDFYLRTPLYAAIRKSEHAFDILETLISFGANVNHQDNDGFTALHLAAYYGLSRCVEKLISLGADVTIKSKKGITALKVITRQTPDFIAVIRHKFDGAITLNTSQDIENKDIELILNFRVLLQHSHPHEISYLNTFVDEGQTEILEHPLCSAFLYIKWEKIRKYYYGRWIFCFVFVLFLTLYVFAAVTQNCYNDSNDDTTIIQTQELCEKQSILGDMLRNNPFVIEMLWWVLVCITIFEIFRKLCGLKGYSSIRQYVTQKETYLEWFVILSVFFIYDIHMKQTYTFHYPIGAFAVLVGWTNLMLMIGQLPVFDVYVAMYTTVLKEFAKLFVAYLCMLVGFTASFYVIFPTSPSFADPIMGFITVLVMMSGEQDLSLLTNNPDGKDPPILLEISRKVTFVLFLVFVTIILMNLLVGIAVHDIQGLKKTAKKSKLVQQTKLIYYMESIIFGDNQPTWLNKILHRITLKSPQPCQKELCVKPLYAGEKKCPRDILMAAYEVAKKHELSGHEILPRCSEAINFSDNDKHHNKDSQKSVRLSRASICAVTPKNDDIAKRMEALTREIKELKKILIQQQQQEK